MKVQLKQLDSGLLVPKYAHTGDAGCDLYSRIDVDIKPQERAIVPTGIAIAIPHGYSGFIHPRSGLAINHGISIVNSPGLIDSSYRGEICVILINHDTKDTFRVKRGDKICQLVIQKVEDVTFEVVKKLTRTRRGTSGFGSTG